jgi:polysaccharide deacetylase family protein (PEP-CTERM system associated)
LKNNSKHILTIDCEDFLSLPAFNKYKPTIDWDILIENQINLVLDALYSANDTKATFFVVGEIAQRNPQLIRRIAQKGHHIGSHSFNHTQVFKQSKKDFEADLKKSIYNIENATKRKVDSYRAPIWSYKKDNLWFWDILKQNKIIYDSSIMPTNKLFFGNPKEKRFINKNYYSIVEIPPSTFRFLGLNFPFSGGIYFRFIPFSLIKNLMKRISNKNNQPIVMYFHPWELDSNLLRVKQISSFYKFILYYNTRKSMDKLKRLLNEFDFTSIDMFLKTKEINL